LRYQSGECGVSGEMLLDGLNVCSQIEQPPHPCDDGRQYLEVWKQYPDFKALLLREVSYGNASQRPVDFDGSQITSSLNKFDTRNRARFEEGEHIVPVVGTAVAKPKRDVLLLFPGSAPPA